MGASESHVLIILRAADPPMHGLVCTLTPLGLTVVFSSCLVTITFRQWQPVTRPEPKEVGGLQSQMVHLPTHRHVP